MGAGLPVAQCVIRSRTCIRPMACALCMNRARLAAGVWTTAAFLVLLHGTSTSIPCFAIMQLVTFAPCEPHEQLHGALQRILGLDSFGPRVGPGVRGVCAQAGTLFLAVGSTRHTRHVMSLHSTVTPIKHYTTHITKHYVHDWKTNTGCSSSIYPSVVLWCRAWAGLLCSVTSTASEALARHFRAFLCIRGRLPGTLRGLDAPSYCFYHTMGGV